ncbi:DNA polymerase/3'-5' exonuclease PolX [Flavihumibacter sp. UBA7668]|uniref:DNA polymerase/3'-5' exonuclease PolX n=1 Tax=Flavihumibacter sp. UBA7668 TaxID=1946542 RepID=UPI0025BF9159|nr:DNA polymerase/3'-5' exonuclease PolX [Flavihumibacter sp. UBA7668]
MLDNYTIADHFSLLGKLMDIHGENSFKAKSYSSAAFTIEKLPVQLSDTPREKIASLKGIGDSTAKKIGELLDTGKLTALEEITALTPAGILEMMQIKGLGPKKIATIWKEMGIESLGELLYACNENRLLLYKGFGEKTQESVKQSIQFYNAHKGQYLYADIEAYAFQLEQLFQQQFPTYQTSLYGDIKRQSIIITQLDLLSTASLPDIQNYLEKLQFLPLTIEGNQIHAQAPEGAKLVVHQCLPEEFTQRLFASTCSAIFLEAFQQNSNTKEDNSSISKVEKALFEAAGFHYLPPNQREFPEALRTLNQPAPLTTITIADIKAIIHSHSNWSDGLESIETMANACIAKGYEYLVLSDHSKSAGYANGLQVERVREQHLAIDELNAKLAPFQIFKSIESDILGDGSLDYDDATLQSFDLLIASVHSNLKMTQEKAMQRLLRAIEHPATCILGHMTGRLLLSRPGYPVDHKIIIDACVANGVAIEINAHPRRLDIDWSWIPYAIEKGCLLSINPDAHSTEGFEDIRYGVLAAQKGGLTPQHNLSSFNLEAFKNWLKERKHKI